MHHRTSRRPPISRPVSESLFAKTQNVTKCVAWRDGNEGVSTHVAQCIGVLLANVDSVGVEHQNASDQFGIPLHDDNIVDLQIEQLPSVELDWLIVLVELHHSLRLNLLLRTKRALFAVRVLVFGFAAFNGRIHHHEYRLARLPRKIGRRSATFGRL